MKTGASHTRLLLLLAALLASPSLPAQAAAIGEVVRIRYQQGREVQGRIVSLGEGEVVVASSDSASTTRVKLSAIDTVDRFQGEHSYISEGSLLGLAVGALVGYANANHDTGLVDVGPLAGAFYGGLLGAVLGAGIGAMFNTTEWEPMPKAYLGFALDARGNEMRLSASVRF